jgi:hypothetical protein
VQGDLAMTLILPQVLRDMADQIEAANGIIQNPQ